MGYHPTAWRTRSMSDLCISVDDLRAAGFGIKMNLVGDEWSEPFLEAPDWLAEGTFTLDRRHGVKDGYVQFHVFEPHPSYGSDYQDLQKKILEKTTGNLQYVLVWEGGDSVGIHTWVDGIEDIKDIEDIV